MDQPDVQFTTTSDGVTIAYWSIGAGPPILITHNLFLSHAEMEWTVPSLAGFYEALAQRHQLIRFDPRSSGMSDRTPDLDSTTTGMGLDITAVADASGADEFTLLAVSTMGPVAIDYAARQPDRVAASSCATPIRCMRAARTRNGSKASWRSTKSVRLRGSWPRSCTAGHRPRRSTG